MYLLPIFSSKDIVAQMPEEGRLFVQVDQTFRRYMTVSTYAIQVVTIEF